MYARLTGSQLPVELLRSVPELEQQALREFDASAAERTLELGAKAAREALDRLSSDWQTIMEPPPTAPALLPAAREGERASDPSSADGARADEPVGPWAARRFGWARRAMRRLRRRRRGKDRL